MPKITVRHESHEPYWSSLKGISQSINPTTLVKNSKYIITWGLINLFKVPNGFFGGRSKAFSVMEMQIPWDLEEIPHPNWKMCPPHVMKRFTFPWGNGKLLHKWWKIILANKATKSKTNTIIYFVKRLSKRRDLHQGPLDLQSGAIPTGPNSKGTELFWVALIFYFLYSLFLCFFWHKNLQWCKITYWMTFISFIFNFPWDLNNALAFSGINTRSLVKWKIKDIIVIQ